MTTAPSVRITQVAIVAHDLDATMANYHHILGWGPWQVIDYATLPHHTTIAGHAAPYTMRTAVTSVGDLTFEIVEPGPGPSPYRDFLDTKGEGLHHILCETADGDIRDLAELLHAHAIDPLMGGTINGVLDYTYYDATAALKLIIEDTISQPDPDMAVLAGTTIWPPQPQA